ncbi:hypothetical protein GCK72_007908 [Caenorhabditis remanei]|uniref:DUF38 domain-containing protein n=1 Tax=Caenorhabditis remanei TaxID=31234 RepID=A0A6A5HJA3_CAERE|nr:hypothetical protein GCK72_007908 [Caenorhabditis remanei]KAF1767948.1 hypothetical protein GCK72_007908 [Caenorhabditis remanei]
MPHGLSYPGLRCVLKNLEAVKRAHIIGRSPGLQKVDKLIPLCLKDFYIARDEMTINTLTIKYAKGEVKFQMNGKTISRQISESREDKMKKFFNFYISGRSIIHVDWLCWSHGFLPEDVDLKFRVNSLSTTYSCFNTAISFIDPRSFPLKTLFTSIANTSIFDSQVVKSAETLLLNLAVDRIVTVEDLKKLNNQTVVFKYLDHTTVDMVSLIKYHIETKKATGPTFVISTSDKGFIDNMLHQFELAFGENRGILDGVNERFVPGSSRFSIPISDKSRIHIYAKKASHKGFYEIIVNPVSGL